MKKLTPLLTFAARAVSCFAANLTFTVDTGKSIGTVSPACSFVILKLKTHF